MGGDGLVDSAICNFENLVMLKPEDEEDERDRDSQSGMLSARGGFGGRGVGAGGELETFDENPYTEARFVFLSFFLSPPRATIRL